MSCHDPAIYVIYYKTDLSVINNQLLINVFRNFDCNIWIGILLFLDKPRKILVVGIEPVTLRLSWVFWTLLTKDLSSRHSFLNAFKIPRMGADAVGSNPSGDVNFLGVYSNVTEFLLKYWN